MWKRLLFLVACFFVLAGISGCGGSAYDDQPEMRLTDPDNPDRL
jgi:hypothetical protein